MVLSETWLKKSIADNDVAIEGYNVFRSDGKSKGGGVAIYIKSQFHATVIKSLSIPKQFELLAIDLHYGNNCHLNIVGCYRPPSAVNNTLTSLPSVLVELLEKEFLLLGDLN